VTILAQGPPGAISTSAAPAGNGPQSMLSGFGGAGTGAASGLAQAAAGLVVGPCGVLMSAAAAAAATAAPSRRGPTAALSSNPAKIRVAAANAVFAAHMVGVSLAPPELIRRAVNAVLQAAAGAGGLSYTPQYNWVRRWDRAVQKIEEICFDSPAAGTDTAGIAGLNTLSPIAVQLASPAAVAAAEPQAAPAPQETEIERHGSAAPSSARQSPGLSGGVGKSYLLGGHAVGSQGHTLLRSHGVEPRRGMTPSGSSPSLTAAEAAAPLDMHDRLFAIERRNATETNAQPRSILRSSSGSNLKSLASLETPTSPATPSAAEASPDNFCARPTTTRVNPGQSMPLGKLSEHVYSPPVQDVDSDDEDGFHKHHAGGDDDDDEYGPSYDASSPPIVAVSCPACRTPCAPTAQGVAVECPSCGAKLADAAAHVIRDCPTPRPNTPRGGCQTVTTDPESSLRVNSGPAGSNSPATSLSQLVARAPLVEGRHGLVVPHSLLQPDAEAVRLPDTPATKSVSPPAAGTTMSFVDAAGMALCSMSAPSNGHTEQQQKQKQVPAHQQPAPEQLQPQSISSTSASKQYNLPNTPLPKTAPIGSAVPLAQNGVPTPLSGIHADMIYRPATYLTPAACVECDESLPGTDHSQCFYRCLFRHVIPKSVLRKREAEASHYSARGRIILAAIARSVALRVLQRPLRVLKLAREGEPKERWIWLSPAGNQLLWARYDPQEQRNFFSKLISRAPQVRELSHVRRLALGLFARRREATKLKAAELLPWHCVSIEWQTPTAPRTTSAAATATGPSSSGSGSGGDDDPTNYRTMEIICQSDDDTRVLFMGLQALVPLSKYHLSYGRFLWRRASLKMRRKAHEAVQSAKDYATRLWLVALEDRAQRFRDTVLNATRAVVHDFEALTAMTTQLRREQGVPAPAMLCPRRPPTMTQSPADNFADATVQAPAIDDNGDIKALNPRWAAHAAVCNGIMAGASLWPVPPRKFREASGRLQEYIVLTETRAFQLLTSGLKLPSVTVPSPPPGDPVGSPIAAAYMAAMFDYARAWGLAHPEAVAAVEPQQCGNVTAEELDPEAIAAAEADAEAASKGPDQLGSAAFLFRTASSPLSVFEPQFAETTAMALMRYIRKHFKVPHHLRKRTGLCGIAKDAIDRAAAVRQESAQTQKRAAAATQSSSKPDTDAHLANALATVEASPLSQPSPLPASGAGSGGATVAVDGDARGSGAESTRAPSTASTVADFVADAEAAATEVAAAAAAAGANPAEPTVARVSRSRRRSSVSGARMRQPSLTQTPSGGQLGAPMTDTESESGETDLDESDGEDAAPLSDSEVSPTTQTGHGSTDTISASGGLRPRAAASRFRLPTRQPATLQTGAMGGVVPLVRAHSTETAGSHTSHQALEAAAPSLMQGVAKTTYAGAVDAASNEPRGMVTSYAGAVLAQPYVTPNDLFAAAAADAPRGLGYDQRRVIHVDYPAAAAAAALSASAGTQLGDAAATATGPRPASVPAMEQDVTVVGRRFRLTQRPSAAGATVAPSSSESAPQRRIVVSASSTGLSSLAQAQESPAAPSVSPNVWDLHHTRHRSPAALEPPASAAAHLVESFCSARHSEAGESKTGSGEEESPSSAADRTGLHHVYEFLEQTQRARASGEELPLAASLRTAHKTGGAGKSLESYFSHSQPSPVGTTPLVVVTPAVGQVLPALEGKRAVALERAVASRKPDETVFSDLPTTPYPVAADVTRAPRYSVSGLPPGTDTGAAAAAPAAYTRPLGLHHAAISQPDFSSRLLESKCVLFPPQETTGGLSAHGGAASQTISFAAAEALKALASRSTSLPAEERRIASFISFLRAITQPFLMGLEREMLGAAGEMAGIIRGLGGWDLVRATVDGATDTTIADEDNVLDF